MELVKVCAFALMGVLLALQFKGGKQEYGIYLGAALAVVVFSCTLSYMGRGSASWFPESVKTAVTVRLHPRWSCLEKSLFCLPECRFSLHWRKRLQDLQEGKGWNLGIQSIIWNS